MNRFPIRIGIIVSKFNETITNGLLEGAIATLKEKALSPVSVHFAPGAFEIPLLAQALAQSKTVDGIVCLGCVIKGDTAHFEFISLGATIGLQEASLKTGVPITFGILTTYTEEQAVARSRKDSHNKGREATLACLESLVLLEKIRLR